MGKKEIYRDVRFFHGALHLVLLHVYWYDMFYKLPNAYQPTQDSLLAGGGGKFHWQTGWGPRPD